MNDMQHALTQPARDDAATPPLHTLLWVMLGSALVWALYLGLSYVLVTYACTVGWGSGTRIALLALSAVALAGIVHAAWVARRHWHLARAIDRPTHDAWNARMGERTARVSFIMVTGLFLALLFGIGVIYSALTLYSLPLCAAGLPA